MRLLPGLVALSIGGCAAMEAARVESTEQLLAAAGFNVKSADTPGKMAHLQTLTQRKLVMHPKDDKVCYVYADAKYCRCAYLGPEEAYQRYRQLAVQQQIAQEQPMAAQANEDAAMN